MAIVDHLVVSPGTIALSLSLYTVDSICSLYCRQYLTLKIYFDTEITLMCAILSLSFPQQLMLPDQDNKVNEYSLRAAMQEKLLAADMSVSEFTSDVEKYLSAMSEQDEEFEKEYEILSQHSHMSDVQREQLDQIRSLRAQAKAQMDAIREVAFSLGE